MATADISLVHAADGYVVIDKPAGLLSVPGKGPGKRDCVAARVRDRFPEATGPLVVHRLDMETSGLMVLALDPGAQRHLSIQFERRSVEKRYTALVRGRPPADGGTIDLPIRADIDRRPLQIVDHQRGKPAITRWGVLARETDRARLWLVPLTGRTHQLRVHLAHPEGLGHPILGDTLYGADPDDGPLRLHASALSFVDPRTGRRVQFERPAPF